MSDQDTPSPSEQIMDNIDFRINSLSRMLTSGIATEDRMTPLERRIEIQQRRRSMVSEILDSAMRRGKSELNESSESRANNQSTSTGEGSKTSSITPPSMSEVSVSD